MPTWYKTRHKFSHEHNIENNRSHNRLKPNPDNVVINNNKFAHEQWHIVTVDKDIILSITGYCFEHYSKVKN